MIKSNVTYNSFHQFENLSGFDGLINFVSTRKSGNMAFVNGEKDEVLKNIVSLLKIFEIDLHKCVFATQVHSTKVGVVGDLDEIHVENGVRVFKSADALVTNKRGVCLAIKTADCVPIIVYDPKNKAIGVVHAGWRGSLKNICKKVVKTFENEFNSDPQDLIVGIGPSLGPEDFYVRQDVQKMFKDKGYEDYLTFKSEDQWLLDLWGINKKQLVGTGIKESNIEISRISTFTSNVFFSYRKKDPMGHFITGAMLL